MYVNQFEFDKQISRENGTVKTNKSLWNELETKL